MHRAVSSALTAESHHISLPGQTSLADVCVHLASTIRPSACVLRPNDDNNGHYNNISTGMSTIKDGDDDDVGRYPQASQEGSRGLRAAKA